jgi:predicted nucleotidyltransferase
VDELRPVRIVLFGSRARGDDAPDSDLDLFIEMTTALGYYDRMRAIYQLFPRRTWPMDVIVLTPDEVREQRKYRNSMIRDIEAEGRVLYEQPR